MAYNYTIDRKRLVEIVSAYIEQKSNTVNWVLATPKLNELFSQNATKAMWRKRYENAKEALKRIGADKPTNEVATSVEDITQEEIKEKIISLLKGGSKSVLELSARFNLSRIETLGLLADIQNEGVYKLKTTNATGELRYIIDTTYANDKEEYNHAVGGVKTYTFMVLSDSHMGSVNEQTSFLHYLYDYAKSRGIKTVYHCGDISEGYKQSRPDHIYSLHAISFDDQLEHIVKAYPQRKGITTYFITGNHDHFHIQNGGANIGKAIQARRPDMKYLGINTAVIKFGDNTRVELFHPQDGSSYATSYAGQKYLDSLNGGDKPNILFVGHHHKSIYFLYRNVHYFEVPSTHSQSDWEKGKRIQNTSGAWIVTIDIDEEGTVTRIVPESIIQFKHIKDDWKQWKELTK
jgi:hypothetical protein